MRLIGTVAEEKKGLAFSLFLRQQGIQHQLEIATNTDWGSPDYGTTCCQIWIIDEDQVPSALHWYEEFLSHPENPIFQHSSLSPPLPPSPLIMESKFKEPDEEEMEQKEAMIWHKQPMGPITRGLLIACCALFFLSQFLTPTVDLPEGFPATPLFSSPLEKAMLYDYPHTYELVDRFIKLYGYEALQDPSSLPKEGLYLMRQIKQTPYWQGFYSYLKNKELHTSNPEKGLQAPLFEKIRQGQLWRLFSPCLFHGDLFHLFFNMLWLIVLGKQLEQRLSPWRYMAFILVVGIFSNTAQYLMGGPNFIGLSGVLVGMLAFIWVRQRRAPWESYQMDRTTIIFMLIFVVGMAFLQTLSFFLETSLDMTVSPGLANTAHLAGGIAGLALGYLNFFNWKHASRYH